MKQWLAFSLILTISLNGWCGPNWQSALNDYLANPGVSHLEQSIAQGRMVDTIYTLPDADYQAAVLKLGDAWSTQPDAAYPIIEKLQLNWDVKCAAPIEIAANKNQEQFLHESEYLAALAFLLSLYKPARLPQILAAYLLLSPANAATAECQRRAPFDLLGALASTRRSLDETVAREQDQVAGEVAATLGWTAGSMALSRFAGVAGAVVTKTAAAGAAVKQFLILTAISYGIYLVADGAAFTMRENNLVSDWTNASNQLQAAFSKTDLEIDSATQIFFKSTARLYSFYAYNQLTAEAELKVDADSKDATTHLQGMFQNLCAVDIEKRFLIQDLLSGKGDQARHLLQSSTAVSLAFDSWVHQWQLMKSNGQMSVAFADQEKADEDFLQLNDGQPQWLRKIDGNLQRHWTSCHDGLYFLFMVADQLNSWAASNPALFTSNPALSDVQKRIERSLQDEHKGRQTFLAGVNAPVPDCAYIQAGSDSIVCRSSGGLIHRN